MKKIAIMRVSNYSLLATSVLMILSGYGITKHRLIEKITFGLLNKPTSFSLHSYLGVAFIVLLIAHIVSYSGSRMRK
ncbi:hypothetical protein ACFL08_02920 [Patescibacteria group bacterium]